MTYCIYKMYAFFNSVSLNVLEARNISKAQADISNSSSIIKYPKASCRIAQLRIWITGVKWTSSTLAYLTSWNPLKKEKPLSLLFADSLFFFSATASFWKPLLALSSIPWGVHLLVWTQCVVEFLFFRGLPPNSQISVQRLILTYEYMVLA